MRVERSNMAIMIRAAQWPQDIAALSALDTTFETDRIYRAVRGAMSFRLVKESIQPPLRKTYEFDPADLEERQKWDFTAVAEDEGQLAGFAAAQFVAWNRRVVLWHLYVAPAFRRHGIGTRLLEAVETFARSVQARCVWLETQNVNVPAIEFYDRAGFRFCGFDSSLYDPDSLPQKETALFFARPICSDWPDLEERSL